jgi:hypothetical protein
MWDSTAGHLQLGHAVRHVDTAAVGRVIGVVLGEVDRVIVRWPDGMSFELLNDLVSVYGPA